MDDLDDQSQQGRSGQSANHGITLCPLAILVGSYWRLHFRQIVATPFKQSRKTSTEHQWNMSMKKQTKGSSYTLTVTRWKWNLPEHIAGRHLRVCVHNSKNSQTQNLGHCDTVDVSLVTSLSLVLWPQTHTSLPSLLPATSLQRKRASEWHARQHNKATQCHSCRHTLENTQQKTN